MEVLLFCDHKMFQFEPKKLSNIQKISLTILLIVCETFRELDGPKNAEDLSSYAVSFLKENSVLF